MSEKNNDKLIPVDLKGHSTQDDFEYNENFNILVLNGAGFMEMTKPENPITGRDKGDSAIVGSLGD